MNRRSFLCGLTFGTLCAPLAAEAQQAGKVYRIGVLAPVNSPAAAAPYLSALKGALKELGWIEGQNIAFEERYAAGKPETMPDLAADLVRLQVDAIITVAVTPTRIAMKATKSIPIIMAPAADAVENGLVASLSHPGGNVTGISYPTSDLSAKGLEFLTEAVQKAARVGVLFNPSFPANYAVLRDVQARAQALGCLVQPVEVRTPDEFEAAFSQMRPGTAAVLVLPDPFTFVHSRRIVELTTNQRLPTMFEWREAVVAGGLLAYGPNLLEVYRQSVSVYLHKLLKAVKPADLPVQQPTKFALVINMKTAKALGLTIPPSLLLRADEVIQ